MPSRVADVASAKKQNKSQRHDDVGGPCSVRSSARAEAQTEWSGNHDDMFLQARTLIAWLQARSPPRQQGGRADRSDRGWGWEEEEILASRFERRG